MMEFFQIMFLPFLACLILTGIHAYLGLHVIERQVIFVDLALAQIAVLGASIALIAGYGADTLQGYLFSLLFAVIGAAIFAMTRYKKQKVPQEAIIGIVYVVCAALMVIVLGYSGEGTEHIRQSLVGNILLVGPGELIKMLVIYSVVGMIHYIHRTKFFLISHDPQQAFREGINVRAWDFLFYVTFGFVVTSSVQIAGVLLVFSFLVIPAVAAMILTDDLKKRLYLGWIIGTAGSLLGMIVSYFLDLPSGASVVCTFGVLLLLLTIGKWFITSQKSYQ